MPILPLDHPEPFAAVLGVMLYPGTDEDDRRKARAFAAQYLAEPLRRFLEDGGKLSYDTLARIAMDAGAPLTDLDDRCWGGAAIGDLFKALFFLAKNAPALASLDNAIRIYKKCAKRAGSSGSRTQLYREKSRFLSVAHLWGAWSIRETVRTIFRRYLELGSIRSLMEDLDQRGIRTRQREQSDGRVRGGIRFGVGPLAYLLRNRFFIGEVVYRGSTHRGEHEPIVDRDLFEAVQAKLAAGATARQLRLRSSPAILAGRIFDDRGNRLTHTHTNKRGARYRYYVSHAILQKRNSEAGSIARVPAADIEFEVVKAVRERLESTVTVESPIQMDDRELIELYVDHVVIKRDMIEVRLSEAAEPRIPGPQRTTANNRKPDDTAVRTIAVPWSAPAFAEIKGILHSPLSQSMTSLEDRDRLLTAIAKARNWIDDLVEGRVTSFDEIAKREGKVVRHIRLLAPLAFVSPRVIAAIIERSASTDLKVTSLAKMLTLSWHAQERRIGLERPEPRLSRSAPS